MFAGMAIQLSAFHRTVRKNQSFKMLDPKHHQPVKSVLQDIDGNEVERSKTGRGIETGKMVYPLPSEALAMIERVGKTEVVEIERFAPLASVPIELALESYVLVPNEKIPGADQGVQLLWNGLTKTKRAAIIDGLALSSGARPSIFAIMADEHGLTGYVMPFEHEIGGDAPAWKPEANARAGKLFAAVLDPDPDSDENYSLEAYDATVYHDTYAERRQTAIDMALAGKVVVVEEQEVPPVETGGDMMLKLEAMLKARTAPAKSKTAAKPRTTAKKPAAKPRAKAKV